MAETFEEIPDRETFKSSDVCEIAKLQPYVLRSWEQEFPNLGIARTSGGPRTYRRSDVERVLRIKQLVFGEGLTLAGVRRRLDGDGANDAAPIVLDDDARARLTGIKQELRSLLDLLERAPGEAADAGGTDSQPSLPDLNGGTPWPPKGREAARKGRSRPAKKS